MGEYAIYLRKSRADLEAEAHGDGETLARHKETLSDFAKHHELNIVQIYSEVVSGETIAARPVAQQLLSDVEQNKWDGVLVMEIERLARGDTIDQGIIARTFKDSSTKIITPMKTYDPNNEYDEEYFEFGLFMSRREYKTITRRIQRGRLASAKEGKVVVSTPPYGYDKVKIKNDKGYTFQLNPDESPVVKLIYKLYNDGLGMGEISTKLDTMGISPRHTKFWSKATIGDILKNPTYIGKIRWGYRKEKKTNVGDDLIKKRYKSDEYIYVKGLHEPIIDEDVFEKAQEIRKLNTHKCVHKNLSLQNPIAGLVYCQKCGRLMTRLGANGHTEYDALVCPNKYCNNISAPIFLIESKIIDTVLNELNNYQIILDKNQLTIKDDRINILNQSLKKLNSNLDNLNLQISKTYDLLEQGIYTTEIFTQRNHELLNRKEELILSINQTELEIEKINSNKKMNLEIIPNTISLLKEYNSFTNADEKNALLKQFINRVEYIKTKPNTKGKLLNDNFDLVIENKILPTS